MKDSLYSVSTHYFLDATGSKSECLIVAGHIAIAIAEVQVLGGVSKFALGTAPVVAVQTPEIE